MRQVCAGVVAVCLLVTGKASGSDERADAVLKAARRAIGGPVESGAVRALTVSGRGKRAIGPMQIAGSFELYVLLPERAMRIDRLSVGGLRSEITSGFDGSLLIQRARGADGITLDPEALLPADIRQAARATAVRGARQDLALLLLGLVADSFPFFPLEFSYAGTADAPDGSADVILAQGRDLTARLFIDARTRRPLLVSWNAPDVLGAARQLTEGTRGAPPAAADVEARARGPLVEHRLYFEAPRQSGAVTTPTLIRRAVGGRTTEEMTIDGLALNPAIDPALFEAGR